MNDEPSSIEKITAEPPQDLAEAKWTIVAEKLSSYTAIVAASLLITMKGFTTLIENLAIKYHAENPDQHLTLDQANELHQMLGLIMSFILFRVVILGVLAIPRHIFFKTAFGRRVRKLARQALETSASQIKRRITG